jgi:hypothetical protein
VGPIAFSVSGLALPLAFVVDFLGYFAIGLCAFWMESTAGLTLIYSRLTMLLGGMLMPMDIFPEGLKRIVQSLPFASIVYGPARLFVAGDFGVFQHTLSTQIAAVAGLGGLVWMIQRIARLTLICPETVSGRDRFRGLGELRAEELELLFPMRAEVTAEQNRIAQLAWQAYGNDDPRAIEHLLQSGTSALPLLAPALRAHLERFPSVANGLGILGQETLEILALEPLEFHELFGRVSATPEIFRHGMGDLQFQAYLVIWAFRASAVDRGEWQFQDYRGWTERYRKPGGWDSPQRYRSLVRRRTPHPRYSVAMGCRIG